MSTIIEETGNGPDRPELIPRSEDRTTARRFALWFGVLGGLVSWAAHLGIAWGLVPYSCAQDNVFWLHANTIVFAIITVIAFLTALNAFRTVRDSSAEYTSRSTKAIQTDRFMSLIGMLASAYFLLLIVAEGVSVFVLSPCGIAT